MTTLKEITQLLNYTHGQLRKWVSDDKMLTNHHKAASEANLINGDQEDHIELHYFYKDRHREGKTLLQNIESYLRTLEGDDRSSDENPSKEEL